MQWLKVRMSQVLADDNNSSSYEHNSLGTCPHYIPNQNETIGIEQYYGKVSAQNLPMALNADLSLLISSVSMS